MAPEAAAAALTRPPRRLPGWAPLALMTILMLAIGAYAGLRSPDFLSSYNINTLLGSSGALVLAIVAMGQVSALMVGGFDVSVGALMTLTVVIGSKGLLTAGTSGIGLVLGGVVLLGVGLLVGLRTRSSSGRCGCRPSSRPWPR